MSLPKQNAALADVIMPSYNMAETIEEAIESVLAQDYANFKLYVVNDGSNDNTAGVAKRFLAGGEKFDPRVELVERENGGKVAALNSGLAVSVGDFVGILDADDTWPPDSLSARIAALNGCPECVAVYADAVYMDYSGKPYRTRSSRPVTAPEQLVASLIVPIIGTTLMVRGPVIRAMAPLDTSFLRSDDAYINMEVYRRGRLLHLPKVVLNYRNYPRPDNLKLRVKSVYHMCRVIARYYRGPKRYWLMALQTGISFMKLVYETFSAKK